MSASQSSANQQLRLRCQIAAGRFADFTFPELPNHNGNHRASQGPVGEPGPHASSPSDGKRDAGVGLVSVDEASASFAFDLGAVAE